MQDPFDVVVLGAGAAGMMCAIEAGRRGRRVLVLDHAKAAGEKIRISGGGRCNFTNLHTAPDRFLSANPSFCISALRRYRPQAFIALVDAAGIAWHEKTLGQLFCDGSAQQIVGLLLGQMGQAGVQLRLGVTVDAVRRGAEGGFAVRASGTEIACEAVVVATGGKSIPKMGATGFGYDLARAVRRAGDRDAAGPRAPHLRGGPAGAHGLPGRGLDPRARGRRQGGLRGGAAVHPPRPVGPGRPAGLLLLARRPGHRPRPRPRRRPRGGTESGEAGPRQAIPGERPGPPLAAATGRNGWRRA